MRIRFASFAELALSLLVLVSALGGIYLPSIYARETPSWAAQGIGQDWVNLLLCVPWLFLASLKALRDSRSAFFLLGGAFVYLVYSYVLYAFDVHFNSLFLVYCATLGLSFFALFSILFEGVRMDVRAWFEEKMNVKVAGVFQVAIALLFGLLWLGQVIPALIRGEQPPGLEEVGLVTNPVHVLDLSLLLPGLAISGVALMKGRSLGYLLTPMMLGFNVLMSAAIGGMMVVMRQREIPVDLSVATGMFVVSIASVLILVAFLRKLKPRA